MKNVILIEHSPLYKKAKAIAYLPCCIKQWILTNQQKLNVNENVPLPVAEYKTNFFIVTCVTFNMVRRSSNPSITSTIFLTYYVFPPTRVQHGMRPSAFKTCFSDEIPAFLKNLPPFLRHLSGLDISVYLPQCAFLHRFKFTAD